MTSYKKQTPQTIAIARLLRLKQDLQKHEEKQSEYNKQRVYFDNLCRSEAQKVSEIKKELIEGIDDLRT